MEDKNEGMLNPLAQKVISERDYYLSCSKPVRNRWGDYYRAYKLVSDETKNPFLANLYLPKVHEAVELLASYLVGPNQSVSAGALGKDDTRKAQVAEKWLEFMWKKTLLVRDKLVTWVKQAALFGNGYMKVTWDADKKDVCVEVIPIADLYFDFYQRDIQDSYSVIHRIVRPVEEVKNDERYRPSIRKRVVGGDAPKDERNTTLQDQKVETDGPNPDAELYERWTKDRIQTVAATSMGYEVLRDVENEYKDSDGNPFFPFVKMRFKTNPLPNRAYDIGDVEPTLKIQLAFNDLVNEIFDNVSLINNKMWVKRRGAKINPQTIVRRPGGIIEVDNIETDIKGEEVSDIKQSALATLTILDNEFQQASMVANILKSVPGTDTATEAALAQNNSQMLLEMVNQNVTDALSQLAEMVLEVAFSHVKKIDSIKVLDNDEQVAFIEGLKTKDIRGKYDIEVRPDREALVPRVVKQKQMIDLLGAVNASPTILQKYPNLPEKIVKRLLENGGEGDISYFFGEQEQVQQIQPMQGMGGGPALPQNGQMLTPGAVEQSVSPQQIVAQANGQM